MPIEFFRNRNILSLKGESDKNDSPPKSINNNTYFKVKI